MPECDIRLTPTSRARERLLGLGISAALSLAAMSAACTTAHGARRVPAISFDQPTSEGVFAPGLEVPSGRALTLVAAVDPTTSTDPESVGRFKRYIADQVENWIRPGQGTAVIYVVRIAHDTFNPANELLTITLDATPKEPALRATNPRPAEPDYGKCSNPYNAPRCREALKRQYDDAMAGALADEVDARGTYAAAEAVFNAKMVELRAQAHEAADRIRQLVVRPDATGTDLGGLWWRSQELLSSTPAELMVVAVQSDLERWGPQATRDEPLLLPNVHVIVTFFDCREARACESQQSAMTKLLMSAGVATVKYFSPAATAALSDMFAEALQ